MKKIQTLFLFSSALLLTFSISKPSFSGNLNLPSGATNARTCSVTQNSDNEQVFGGLRRALNQGYHVQTTGLPSICSEKITLDLAGLIHLKAPIVLNKTTASGFTLEKGASISGEITLDAKDLPEGTCAITLDAAQITLRKIKIINAKGTGICLEAGARNVVLDEVTITQGGNGLWAKAGSHGNIIRKGAIFNNGGIGIKLDSANQTRVTENALYQNAQGLLTSPNQNIQPNLSIAAPTNATATEFSLTGTVPTPVERIEIFRSVPSQTPSNYIKTILGTELQGLSFVTSLAAQNGEHIFAIAIASDGSTSALSNFITLNSTTGNNASGPRSCFQGQIFPPHVDYDQDGLPDYLEDKNKNCRVDNDETDPIRADTDQDLIPDGIEDFNRNGQRDEGESDPKLLDTDGDGIADGIEDKNKNGRFEFGELSPNSNDTDSDGLLDWQEDVNRNGDFDEGETKAFLADTDLDGLPDGTEDANHNGTVELLESNPRLSDTDGDGLLDGADPCPRVASLLCQEPCVVGQIPPETLDTDQDNIPDRAEDFNHNCVLDTGETNPYLQDTDGDTRVDSNDPCPRNEDLTCSSTCVAGAYVPPNRDSDSDGVPNVQEDDNGNCIVDPGESDPFDPDSDNDGSPDNVDVCPRDSNPLCNHVCVVGQTPPTTVDSDGDSIADVYEDLNHNCTRDGNESDFRQRDTDHDGFYDNQDACPNNPDTSCASSCIPGQFVPPTRDSDRDGLYDVLEDLNNNCLRDITETSASIVDTEGDGIPDGNEDRNHNGSIDTGETSPLLLDSDGDGIQDGLEDRNHNGIADFGELNPVLTDSDQDGIPDRIEDTNLNGTWEKGETIAYLADTDQDGLKDGDEDKNKNGRVDAGETDPRNPDSDGDGASDGQEISQGSNPIHGSQSDLNQAMGKSNCTLHPGASSPHFLQFLVFMGLLIPLSGRFFLILRKKPLFSHIENFVE